MGKATAKAGDTLTLFIPITKIDEEQRLVYGVIAQEELDASGEVFDYSSSKPYFEEWSKAQEEASGGLSKGNVRAMHSSIAAGKLTDLSFNDDGKLIEGCAKVVDDAEWLKCREGVYTGFSMGGRYVKRWQEDGETRYTASPCEVSLVDKPCIKSAKFMLIKADGTTQDVLFKGALPMFVPTNDAVLAKAQTLAKAAGKSDADWLEHADEAREALIAEHDAAEKVEIPAADAAVIEAPADAEEPAPAAEKVDAAVIEDPIVAEEPAPAPAPEAEKADVPELQQGWKAKDGSFHLKKADAISHNARLAKDAAEPKSPLEAAVDGLEATLAKADAPIIEESGEPTLDQRLVNFANFLSDPQVVEKSLYNVSRTTNIMRDMASLYVSVQAEAKAEGDGSAVPASILSAVDTIGNALIEMATEEVGEVMERLREKAVDGGDAVVDVYVYDSYAYDAYYCDLAVSTMGLEKAATPEFFAKAIEVSSKDKARLQRIHDHSVALGAKCAEDDPDAEAADAAEKLAKFDTTVAENEALKKRLEQAEALVPRVEALSKTVEGLLAKAMPPAPRTNVISKVDDASGGAGGNPPVLAGTPDQVLKALVATHGNEAVATAMIKFSQTQGRQIFAHGGAGDGRS